MIASHLYTAYAVGVLYGRFGGRMPSKILSFPPATAAKPP
jgi:hypothetical protein